MFFRVNPRLRPELAELLGGTRYEMFRLRRAVQRAEPRATRRRDKLLSGWWILLLAPFGAAFWIVALKLLGVF